MAKKKNGTSRIRPGMCVVCHPFPVVDIVRPSYVRVACVSEVGKEEEEEEEGRRNMEGRERRAKIRGWLPGHVMVKPGISSAWCTLLCVISLYPCASSCKSVFEAVQALWKMKFSYSFTWLGKFSGHCLRVRARAPFPLLPNVLTSSCEFFKL